ncbi:hypothetical protein DVH24_038468 [Malus domestica]|uniref:Beta-glucosidase n=1 Tax=Malus domestica TaxID=3750 RepID=A0A498KCV1_MALDO|nr:hypothetical protein DVH24_038468 [Malus domestica]
MAMRLQSLLLGVLLLTGFAAGDSKTTAVIPSRYSSASLNRSSFPSGFVFGSASASYQVHGMKVVKDHAHTHVHIYILRVTCYIIERVAFIDHAQTASSWLVVYPKGIREILLYAKHKYNNPLIYITENGNYF